MKMPRLFFALICAYIINLCYAQPDSVWVKIELKTDAFASESSWILWDYTGMQLANSSGLSNNQLYTDSFYLPKDSCQYFQIFDAASNGIDSPGFIRISVDSTVELFLNDFKDEASFYINCQPGESCLKPIHLAGEGLFYTEFERTWYSFSPDSTGIFSFSTCGKAGCDTRIWLYDYCPNKLFDGAEGSLAFNDNKCLLEAEVNSYLLKDSNYLIRLEDVQNSCASGMFFTIIAESTLYGCLDTLACNYDPLANTDNGKCYYYPDSDCHPDLQIDQVELVSSVLLDTIAVDSFEICLLEEGCVTGLGKRDVIKFTTTIENIGGTDFYLGNPRDNPAIFNNTNCHDHYHYEGYADYFLIDSFGYRIPIGFKNGFCLMDTECDSVLPKFNCQTQGISSTCNDVYDFKTECQWIDITTIKDGVYTLVNRVNGQKRNDAFGRYEVAYDNNWAQVCVRIQRTDNDVQLAVLPNCDDFYDCNGVKFGDATIDCNGDCNGTAIYGDLISDGEVDELDLSYLRRLALNENSFAFPCYDLNQDQKLDLGDVFLLNDCVRHQDSITHSHNHPECVYPKRSIYLDKSVAFSITKMSTDSSYFEVSVNTFSEDLNAYQLNFSGIFIQDVQQMTTAGDVQWDQNSIQLMGGNTSIISDSLELMLRVYFRSKTGTDTLRLNTNSQALNADGSFYTIITPIEHYVLSNKTIQNYVDVNAGIRVYPVPAKDKLFIEIRPEINIKHIQLFDTNGQLIFNSENKNSVEINVESMKSGLYYLQIITQKSVINRPISVL